MGSDLSLSQLDNAKKPLVWYCVCVLYICFNSLWCVYLPYAAAGARVQTTVNNLDKAVLGGCERFEERQVRVDRCHAKLMTGCHYAR